MSTYKRIGSIVLLLVAIVIVPHAVNATSEQDIVFPVAELGNCEDKEQCKAYCDSPDNIHACITFAEKHNLMSAAEAAEARKFQSIQDTVGTGPGGCTGHQQCEAYCDDVNNIRECVAFAEEHDLMAGEELAEARQVMQALDQGVEMPGGCTSKDSCEAYCEDPSNMRECMAFAEAAGFMTKEELEEGRQFLEMIEGGRTPGSCRGDRECRAYCEDPENMTECVDFAVEVGHMSAEEAEMMRVTGGRGPGGCRGEECEAYCEDPAHEDECRAFGEEHGMMDGRDGPPDGDFTGPGGCSSRESCEAYCSHESNREECSRFGGSENRDDMHEQEFDHDDEYKREPHEQPDMHMMFGDMPDDVKRCLNSELGSGWEEGLASGDVSPQEMEQVSRQCFEKNHQNDKEDQYPQYDEERRDDYGGHPGFEGEYKDDYPDRYDESYDDHREYRDEHRDEFAPEYDKEREDAYRDEYEGDSDEHRPEEHDESQRDDDEQRVEDAEKQSGIFGRASSLLSLLMVALLPW